MPYTLYEDEFGDPRNARALSVAADIAYFPAAQAVAGFAAEFGMQAELYSAGNTQAYVAHNSDAILVTFRGTEAPTSIEGLKDWLLTDAVNLLIMPEGDLGTDFAAAGVGTRWHSGFMKALEDIWPQVFAAVTTLRKQSDRPLWITGHSLGGALALLAAWRFKRKFVNVHQVYTFGAPMVGNDVTARVIDREFGNKIFRYVNDQDPIPQLPTISLLANAYSHCQTQILLGGSTAATLVQVAAQGPEGGSSGNWLSSLWTGILQRIGAHAMEKYRNHVVALCPPDAAGR
jgi:hypothetical protein